ncbi:hypothetical protein [Dietzia sp. CH92]|uniref:hypothetical protein n=1 Tax=Dietzia sp. CH92 TaxID=3051823 RepID=UPI0028D61C49|nr:hypothetical protein [Dietzia sp. CH92]
MGTDDAPVPEYAADYAPAPDDAPDASHLTPEEKRGPRTVHVALGLLALLLIVAVATTPASVLPRDSTLHGEHHVDEESGLELAVPVGWRVVSDAEIGSVQLVPVGTGRALDTRILAGALEPGIAAAAISDDQGAATALAETIQLYVLGVSGIRDERRVTRVDNDLGTGAAVSYVVVPDEFADLDSGGLVYTAVFGEEGRRWWVAYVTTSQQSAPGVKWMDDIVDGVRPAG